MLLMFFGNFVRGVFAQTSHDPCEDYSIPHEQKNEWVLRASPILIKDTGAPGSSVTQVKAFSQPKDAARNIEFFEKLKRFFGNYVPKEIFIIYHSDTKSFDIGSVVYVKHKQGTTNLFEIFCDNMQFPENEYVTFVPVIVVGVTLLPKETPQ